MQRLVDEEMVGPKQVTRTEAERLLGVIPIFTLWLQVERDLEIKQAMFGVRPWIFRFPEYAVSEDAIGLLEEMGFKGTIVPDSVFNDMELDSRSVLQHGGIRIAGRNNFHSNMIAGNDFDGYNYQRWLAKYGGTPEQMGDDFARRVECARRILTDCDAETYNHWLMEGGVPPDKLNVLEVIYRNLVSRGIKTLHLPEYMESPEGKYLALFPGFLVMVIFQYGKAIPSTQACGKMLKRAG